MDPTPNGRGRKLVVAALIIDTGGHVLLTKRRPDQPLAGYWEFPGGKIEPGEAPEVALRRELLEELGVGIEVGRIWDVLFHAYPDYDVYMLVYRASIREGTPQAIEVSELAWVAPQGLLAYDVLPADAPLVARLQTESPG